MIDSREKLSEFLEYERSLYIKGGIIREFKLKLLHDSEYLLWHYVKMLRYTEYHYNVGNRFRYFLYQRRKNIEGAKLGLSLFHNCFDKGLRLYHYGSIIVNSHVRIGKNCKLHGNNCIGNKGDFSRDDIPIIGENLDLGVGACILGGIKLSNNIQVGANAVVVKSCEEDSSILVGIPAKKINL